MFMIILHKCFTVVIKAFVQKFMKNCLSAAN